MIHLVKDFLVARETTLCKTLDKYNIQAQKIDTWHNYQNLIFSGHLQLLTDFCLRPRFGKSQFLISAVEKLQQVVKSLKFSLWNR